MHFHRMQLSALLIAFRPIKFTAVLELPKPNASLLIIIFPQKYHTGKTSRGNFSFY